MDFQMVLRMKIESEDQPDVVQLSFRDPLNQGGQFNLTTSPEMAATLRVKKVYNFAVSEAPAPAPSQGATAEETATLE